MNAKGSRRQGAFAYVVAPDGQSGGGMGRVKDYIVQAPSGTWGDLSVRPLITRNHLGVTASMCLVFLAACRIVAGRISGRLAFVHVNFGDHGSGVRKGIIVLVSRAVGVRVLLHLHAVQIEREYGTASAALRAIMRLPFRYADVVIVLGERWRCWLRDRLGIDPAKIHVLWNGVPRSGDGPVVPVAERVPEIVFVGNLTERKGVSDLLAALAALTGEAARWRAVLIGGGDLPRYRALAEKLGIGGRIDLTGWLDLPAVGKRVARAGMLVLPSYEEGLPLVILEALGAGTPVVCTPVGSIGEVLADGETALFCRPGDPAGLAAAIDRLAADAVLRQRLAARGLALFAEMFSIDAFRANLQRIWRLPDGREEPSARGGAVPAEPA